MHTLNTHNSYVYSNIFKVDLSRPFLKDFTEYYSFNMVETCSSIQEYALLFLGSIWLWMAVAPLLSDSSDRPLQQHRDTSLYRVKDELDNHSIASEKIFQKMSFLISRLERLCCSWLCCYGRQWWCGCHWTRSGWRRRGAKRRCGGKGESRNPILYCILIGIL